jgi:acyl carrier protein phosphodiesterase
MLPETLFVKNFLLNIVNNICEKHVPRTKDRFRYKKCVAKQSWLARFRVGKSYQSNGAQEMARRRRQIEKGMLKRENGVVI